MGVRLVTLVGAVGLLASAAAGATSSPTTASGSAAPAAGRSFSGGGRGSFGGGIRVGAGGTSLAIAHAGRASGFDFIVAAHGPAATHELAGRGMATGADRGFRSALGLAPATASAAHAIRVVEGSRRGPERAVRRLRPTDRSAALPQGCTLSGGGVYCQYSYLPGCSVSSNGIKYCLQNLQPAQYCFHNLSCPPILTPEPLCVERDSTGNDRYFYCAHPVKMGERN